MRPYPTAKQKAFTIRHAPTYSKPALKWHKGKPPSLGWWIASFNRSHDVLRWWDGKVWSVAVHTNERPNWAEAYARIPEEGGIQGQVEWWPRPESWPERSKT